MSLVRRFASRSPFASLTSLAAATLVALLPLAVQAQSQAPTQPAAQPAASSPVNITGRRDAEVARRDVSKVCPAVHTELPEALASAWQQVTTSGVVRLRFTLEGGNVVAAQALEGPRAYHRWVRSAIYGVNCSSDQPGRQVFEVAVRFADPAELGARKVALLTP